MLKRSQADDIFKLPLKQQFILIGEFENGGYVWQHKNVNTQKSDFAYLKRIALHKAEQGKQVELLPEIHIHQQGNVRRLLLPDYGFHPKNPDLKINGAYYEVEATQNYKNIAHRISSAAKQAEHVIILFDGIILFRDENLCSKMFKEHQHLKTIELIANNRVELFIK